MAGSVPSNLHSAGRTDAACGDYRYAPIALPNGLSSDRRQENATSRLLPTLFRDHQTGHLLYHNPARAAATSIANVAAR